VVLIKNIYTLWGRKRFLLRVTYFPTNLVYPFTLLVTGITRNNAIVEYLDYQIPVTSLNAIVEYLDYQILVTQLRGTKLDYQIPVTQLKRRKGNRDMQVAKRD